MEKNRLSFTLDTATYLALKGKRILRMICHRLESFAAWLRLEPHGEKGISIQYR
jgi:hypothetical protein